MEGLGSNLRLELAVTIEHEAQLLPALRDLKLKVDHQCLFNEGMPWAGQPSTLENIAWWLSRELPEPWVSLTVWETEKLGCRISSGTDVALLILKQNNVILKVAGAIDKISGLALERTAVQRAVSEQLVKLSGNNDSRISQWSEKLFREFKNSIPGLCSLAIDLGSHETLVVHS